MFGADLINDGFVTESFREDLENETKESDRIIASIENPGLFGDDPFMSEEDKLRAEKDLRRAQQREAAEEAVRQQAAREAAEKEAAEKARKEAEAKAAAEKEKME